MNDLSKLPGARLIETPEPDTAKGINPILRQSLMVGKLGPLLTWRGVTGGDGELSLSFDVPEGVMRMRLSAPDALKLAAAICDCQANSLSHSDRSSGSPIASVSTPQDGVKV